MCRRVMAVGCPAGVLVAEGGGGAGTGVPMPLRLVAAGGKQKLLREGATPSQWGFPGKPSPSPLCSSPALLLPGLQNCHQLCPQAGTKVSPDQSRPLAGWGPPKVLPWDGAAAAQFLGPGTHGSPGTWGALRGGGSAPLPCHLHADGGVPPLVASVFSLQRKRGGGERGTSALSGTLPGGGPPRSMPAPPCPLPGGLRLGAAEQRALHQPSQAGDLLLHCLHPLPVREAGGEDGARHRGPPQWDGLYWPHLRSPTGCWGPCRSREGAQGARCGRQLPYPTPFVPSCCLPLPPGGSPSPAQLGAHRPPQCFCWDGLGQTWPCSASAPRLHQRTVT